MSLILCGIIGITFISTAERYIMPAAAEICLAEAKERANYIINSAAEDVLGENKIELDDILKLQSENGITTLSADTVIVNMICAQMSSHITDELQNMENNKVSIPYGAATGIGILSNCGPAISFEVKPVGGAEVDYETEFTSAGINQTNYKIWLTVNIDVSLVNPLYNRKVSMTRKLMLVDTIIKGDVPYNYLGIQEN
ncbi:MAG: sporulation protein YunB [Clostridiales bacterium]|nr:sporulation protein YunB [Clostridiales bacterium]